jgi:hypothetical protein
MALIVTNRLRVVSLVGLSSGTYREGLSLPSARAADADGRAGTSADSDRIGRARLTAERPTGPENEAAGRTHSNPKARRDVVLSRGFTV